MKKRTSWSSSNDHEVKEVLTLDVGERRLRSELEAFEDTRADLAGVLDVLEEVSVLLDLLKRKRNVEDVSVRGQLRFNRAPSRAPRLTPGVLKVCE